ncbi:MAG TPA: DUF4175 domain-containing protein [Intrasporangiaceae bacterium]|nr:DUF4175 domain-containing protein [Intrasporangiaceae bacterium]
MTLFLIIGGVGVVLLLITLVRDGVLDILGDVISGPAVAAFLTAFGFGGALALNAGASTGLAVVVGLVLGAIIGLGAGFVRTRLTKGGDEADGRTGGLVGRDATVVTDIPAGGFGTVSIVASGHVTTLNARSGEPVAAGTPVVISAVLSPTSVAVEPRRPDA